MVSMCDAFAFAWRHHDTVAGTAIHLRYFSSPIQHSVYLLEHHLTDRDTVHCSVDFWICKTVKDHKFDTKMRKNSNIEEIAEEVS